MVAETFEPDQHRQTARQRNSLRFSLRDIQLMKYSQTTKTPETICWCGDVDGHLVLLDQTRLPTELVTIECRDVDTVSEAIRSLRVRGAPAIGIAAAYAVSLGMQRATATNHDEFFADLKQWSQQLASSRPTAVNLFWALDRIQRHAQAHRESSLIEIRKELLVEARRIHEEDRVTCHAIGRHGSSLLRDGASVLTHCNAGGLATAEYGTALSVFFTAQDQDKHIHVFVDETRPLLQGARLTAWELTRRGIPSTLICDSMAAQVMKEGRVEAVITGADRIAANGDAANKIGTYALAVLAQFHGIPFYIAAPRSTFDLSLPSGDAIPIEQRDRREITHAFDNQTAPNEIDVYNPAFDVTPAELITAIITECGIIQPVDRETIHRIIVS